MGEALITRRGGSGGGGGGKTTEYVFEVYSPSTSPYTPRWRYVGSTAADPQLWYQAGTPFQLGGSYISPSTMWITVSRDTEARVYFGPKGSYDYGTTCIPVHFYQNTTAGWTFHVQWFDGEVWRDAVPYDLGHTSADNPLQITVVFTEAE